MRIGFVGVGKMGKPMVLRLAGAGHEVRAYDRSQEAVAAVAGTKGVVAAPTAADAARGAEMIVTMLPNGRIVAEAAREMASAPRRSRAFRKRCLRRRRRPPGCGRGR